MAKEKGKDPTQRQLRVSEEIRRVIAKMLLQDNLFVTGLKPQFIMITEVMVSPDFSYATAFVQTLGDVDVDEQILLLNQHKGAFRYQIGKAVRLRIVPEVTFKSDTRFEHSKYIDSLLNLPRVRQDIESASLEDEEQGSDI